MKYFFLKVKNFFWIFEVVEQSIRYIGEVHCEDKTVTNDQIILFLGQDISSLKEEGFSLADKILFLGNGCTFFQRDKEDNPNRWVVWNGENHTVQVLFGSVISVRKDGVSCSLLVGREKPQSPVVAFLGEIEQI